MNKVSCPSNVLEGSNKANYLHIGPTVAGKIIRLLRDSIYSHKWGSFVREVIANAYDANIENNYNGPVEITLPSLFHQELTIKDHGKGMSREFMETCYTNVGLSTKELDTTQGGAFGLGRLTPLLISDSYKVETNHNGIKSIYTMAIGERDGLMLEWEGETTDIGTTIRVFCDSKNNGSIKDAIKEWCSYMTPLPLIDTVQLTAHHKYKSFPNLENKNFWCQVPYLSSSNSYNYKYDNIKYDNIIVLNDWVPYTLDKNSLPNELQSKLNKLINYKSNRYGLLIKFPNGALDIITSRENIAYTNKTITAISNAVDKFTIELKTEYTQQIEKIDSLREVLLLSKDFPQFVSDNVIWKDINLNSLSLYSNKIDGCTYTYKSFKLTQLKWSKKKYGSSINLINEKHVFIDDLVKKHKADRISHYLTNKQPVELHLISPTALDNNLVKQLDWPLLSTLEVPPKVRQSNRNSKDKTTNLIRTNTKEVKAYKWNGYSNNTLPNVLTYSDPISLPSDKNGMCLYTIRGKITRGLSIDISNLYTTSCYGYTINKLLSIIPKDRGPLYIIPECNAPLLKGNWELLIDVVYEVIGDKLQEFSNISSYENSLAYYPKEFEDSYNWIHENKNLVWLAKCINKEPDKYKLDDSNIIMQYFNESLKVKTFIEENSATIWAVKLLNTTKVSNTTELNSIHKLIEKIEVLYPLIWDWRVSNFSYCDTDYAQYLIDYIKGIDLLNKQDLNTV